MAKGTCKEASCEKDAVGKGYCSRHYQMWRRGKMPKARYKTCVEDGCRKPQAGAGRCADHQKTKAPAVGAETAPAAS